MIKTTKYNTLSDFSEDLKLPIVPICQKWISSTGESSWDTKWRGTASFDEADRLMNDGDKKSAKKLVDAVTNCTYNGTRRAGLQPAVVGCVPCVPNAVRNIPLSMFRPSKRPAKPVLNLLLSVIAPHTVKAATITANAAKVLSAVRAIEAAGYSVSLSVCCFFADKYQAWHELQTNKTTCDGFMLNVKSAGEHLDVERLAYIICNPSFLRRHAFKWYETHYSGTSEEAVSHKGIVIVHPDAIDATKENGTVEEIIETIKQKAI